MSRSTPKLLVLCLGNPDRGDDGAGVAVASVLAGRMPSGVTLHNRSGDMLALIEDWAGYDGLVCVDAAASMGTPGRIHRFDLRTALLPREMALMSSHAFGLGEAIALAQALDLAPRQVVVFAVEGQDFAVGSELSPAVRAAIGPLCEMVIAEAKRLQEGTIHA